MERLRGAFAAGNPPVNNPNVPIKCEPLPQMKNRDIEFERELEQLKNIYVDHRATEGALLIMCACVDVCTRGTASSADRLALLGSALSDVYAGKNEEKAHRK